MRDFSAAAHTSKVAYFAAQFTLDPSRLHAGQSRHCCAGSAPHPEQARDCECDVPIEKKREDGIVDTFGPFWRPRVEKPDGGGLEELVAASKLR